MKRDAMTVVFFWLAVAPWAAGDTRPSAPAPASRSEAAGFHRRLVESYMGGKWSDLEALLARSGRFRRFFSYAQQKDVEYVRAAYRLHRPEWWPQTRSFRPTRFKARIWTRSFTATYVPSALLGLQAVVGKDPKTGELQIIVTWDPRRVEDPTPARQGYLAAHRMTEANLGEAIVWHELGHNYVTQGLPADQVMELFESHRELFAILQEFYADLTALYHCSPQGRKATMMIRVPQLAAGAWRDPHARAAYGIGAFILARILTEPAKWPSFRLPGRLPDRDAERYAILYLYTHIDPGYTLAEDRALRGLLGRFVRTRGASVLKKRGTVTLPSGLTWKCLPAEDAKYQPRRDAWVRSRLAKALKAGAAR